MAAARKRDLACARPSSSRSTTVGLLEVAGPLGVALEVDERRRSSTLGRRVDGRCARSPCSAMTTAILARVSRSIVSIGAAATRSAAAPRREAAVAGAPQPGAARGRTSGPGRRRPAACRAGRPPAATATTTCDGEGAEQLAPDGLGARAGEEEQPADADLVGRGCGRRRWRRPRGTATQPTTNSTSDTTRDDASAVGRGDAGDRATQEHAVPTSRTDDRGAGPGRRRRHDPAPAGRRAVGPGRRSRPRRHSRRWPRPSRPARTS